MSSEVDEIALDAALDAIRAWSVLGSLHESYCRGRDPFFKTRAGDYARHLAAARDRYDRLRAAWGLPTVAERDAED